MNAISDSDWDDGCTEKSAAKSFARPKRPTIVKLEDIILEAQASRPVDQKKVNQIAKSMVDQGLLQPIHLFRLAAGQHRLQAARDLGFVDIPAIILRRNQARAWRPSENLHRKGLRALEWSESVVEYAKSREALKNVQPVPKCRGGEQPNEKGYKKLADETGFDRKRIAEAFRHQALSNSVKGIVRKSNSLNKRSTLNTLSDLTSEAEQLQYLHGGGKGKKKSESSSKGKAVEGPESGLKKLMATWRWSECRELFKRQKRSVQKRFSEKILA
jgi:hypothetical protein